MKTFLLILALMLALIVPVQAASPVMPTAPKLLCLPMELLHIGEPFEWSDAAFKRGELPDSTKPIGYLFLTDFHLPDELVQMIQVEYAPEWDQVIVFVYWSLREDDGNHDKCTARRLWLPAGARSLLKAVMLP